MATKPLSKRALVNAQNKINTPKLRRIAKCICGCGQAFVTHSGVGEDRFATSECTLAYIAKKAM